MKMKIQFCHHGKYSTLTIINPVLCLRRHCRIVLAAVHSAPNARVNTEGLFILQTILYGETHELRKACIRAHQVAEKILLREVV